MKFTKLEVPHHGFLSLILCMIDVTYSLSIAREVYLTPLNSSYSGTSVLSLNNQFDWTDTPRPEWLLTADGTTPTKGFQLQLSLDESWGFHLTENTTLTFQIEFNTNTGSIWTSYNDLLIAFTQEPYISFFATRIVNTWRQSYNPSDHAIYPSSSWSGLNHDKSYLASGDVELLVNNNEYSSRLTGLTIPPNGGSALNNWQWYHPNIYNGFPYSTSPLTIKLENSPSTQEMIYTYFSALTVDIQNIRSCRYYDMNPDKAMKIFFVGDGHLDTIDIEAIKVSLEYVITDNPTNNPSVDPTSVPSIQPAESTDDPTHIPTMIPSLNPSVPPTASSDTPSNSPTSGPSIDPTSNPTIQPTNNPTKPQGWVNDITTTNDRTGNNLEKQNEDASNDADNLILYIVIALIVAVVFIIILYTLYRKYLHRERMEGERKLSKLNSVSQTLPSPNTMTEMVNKSVIDSNDKNEHMMTIATNVGIDAFIDEEVIGSMSSTRGMMSHCDSRINIEGDTEEMYKGMNRKETSGNSVITKGNARMDQASDCGEEDNEEMDKIYGAGQDAMTPTNDVNLITTRGDEEYGDEVELWFKNKVELSQYYQLFVENGLDSLKLICKLNNEQALIDLGIEFKGHRIILMRYIKELNEDKESE